VFIVREKLAQTLPFGEDLMEDLLPLASIIVTSYNQATTLRLLLASLERQTVLDFEVVIADDGSSDDSERICNEVRKFPVRFVTQADLGYRKSKIVNQSIRKSSADYLIFVDGDVILEKHFVEDHLSLRKIGAFVCGRRVDLGPMITQRIKVSHVLQGYFDRLNCELLMSALKKDSITIKRGIRITNPLLRKIMGYHRPLDLLGSNFSSWKSDILEVNGFNEAIESYWGEDGDIYIRLRNCGKKAIGAKSMCVQYHVFHKRRIPTQENVEWYQKLLQDGNYKRAAQGYQESQ
jgi:glycosyltransferase involved in cell wall biosynthesis